MFQMRPGLVLRDYQHACHDSVAASVRSGVYDPLVHLATGGGKTIVFSALPAVLPELARHGVLVLVHRDELVWQTVAKMRLVLGDNVLVEVEKAEHRASPMARIVVASVQTIGRKKSPRLARLLAYMDVGIVVVDEAHHMRPGSQYDTVLTALGLGSRRDGPSLLPDGQHRLLVGVTATPNRNDKVGLSAFFSEIVFSMGMVKMVRQGYLCEPTPLSITTKTSLKGVGTSMGDFAIGELGRRVNNPERNASIIKAYLKEARRPDGSLMSAMAFCADRHHAHDLADEARRHGIRAASADYLTDANERRAMLLAHESGEIDLLANYGLWVEGYDGRVECLLMARPTKSKPLMEQMLGRGLRTIPSDLGNLPTAEERLAAIASSKKPAALVLDFVDADYDGIVTVPSLFGLPAKFRAEGKRIIRDVVDVVEAASEQNPDKAEAIKAALSLDGVEIEVRRIDFMARAKSHHSLACTRNTWLNIGDGSWQLDVPGLSDTGGSLHLRVEPDNVEGGFRVKAIHPRRFDREAGRYLSEKRVTGSARYGTLEQAVEAVDEGLRQRHPDAAAAVRKDAAWRRGRPTKGQVQMLRRLGIDANLATSSGVASDLISAGLSLSRP